MKPRPNTDPAKRSPEGSPPGRPGSAAPRPGEPAGPDWAALERLRTAFLQGTAGAADYWRNERDLASYDATFAQRIGWKWDFVLEDLRARAWNLPAGPLELLDWGCGSGIAARAVLDAFGAGAFARVRFHDRSPLAMRFAARRARERFPGLDVAEGLAGEASDETPPARVLLLSHVLTELEPAQTEALVELASGAAVVMWVEPGTYEASLALIAVRERIRAGAALHPIAPCLHTGACGILSPGNEPHWCHHFARPPGAVFTDPFWGRFANLVGIDLRSLPLSYLILDRRPPVPPSAAAGLARMLGRPRLLKAEVRVLACRADGGLREHDLARRDDPEAYTAARKDRFPSVCRVDPPA